jgi:hypothetical protein
MEVEPDEGRTHAWFPSHRHRHVTPDRGQSPWARRVVEHRRQLR